MTSACEVLSQQPERFINYVISDNKLRSQIVDEDSFGAVLEKALKSDKSLENIAHTIKNNGESFSVCGIEIYNDEIIQDIKNENISKRRKRIRKRVKVERPELSGRKLKKEIQRRLNISIGGQASKVKKTKQITIQEATKPVTVSSYTRDGTRVEEHIKSKYRSLNKQEEMLIKNQIKRGKKPKEVIKKYYDAGLDFRTETSIRSHYYRIRDQLQD